MNTIILLIIGAILIVLNVKAIGNEKTSFNSVLENKQENVKDYQIEIIKLKEEFSNTILELQKEIEKLKDSIEDNNKKNSLNSKIELDEENYSAKGNSIDKVDADGEDTIYSDDSENTVKSSDGIKVNEIKKLLDEGMSIEDISQKLDLGKGEVLLIKELYIK